MKTRKQQFEKGILYSIALLFIIASMHSCFLLYDAIGKGVKNSRFAPEKVTGISIVFDDPAMIVYGSKRELKIQGTILHKEKKFFYWAEKSEKEKFKFSDFDITVTGGVYEDGKIKVFKKLSQVPNGQLIVKAVYKPKAGIDTTITIDLISNKKTKVYFNGNTGGGGYSGSYGSTGGSWSTECKDGGYGGHGNNGGDGADGPDVEVYVKMIRSNEMNKDLVAVRCVNLSANDTTYDYLDMASSNITVYANGGQGGSGGTGGHGGNGGYTTATGSTGKCRGGDGGDGGDGGNGGNGGRITVIMDPNVDANQVKVSVENEGGSGGYGGTGGQGGYNGGSSSNGQARQGRSGRSGQSGKPGPTPAVMKKTLPDNMFR